jgi:Flp pilus assembly protein TadD
MERSAFDEAKEQFELAWKAMEEEEFTSALGHLEKAFALHDDPDWHSYAGLCIAKERGEFQVAESLCIASIEHDDANPVHYLNLGKVYLAAGKKREALDALRRGMDKGGSERILSLLVQIGTRHLHVFRFLKRSHPLNKYLGLLVHRREIRRRGLP